MRSSSWAERRMLTIPAPGPRYHRRRHRGPGEGADAQRASGQAHRGQPVLGAVRDAVKEHAAEAAEPTGRLHKFADNATVRRDAAYVLVAAGLAALVGGYAGPWKWTGFEANGQVWDWLNLLLLPVVLGTIPLSIQHREYIGKSRRIIHGAFIVAFTGFVLAGYLVPVSWTGFSGQTLWNWIELLVLPAALAITAALAGRGGRYQVRCCARTRGEWSSSS